MSKAREVALEYEIKRVTLDLIKLHWIYLRMSLSRKKWNCIDQNVIVYFRCRGYMVMVCIVIGIIKWWRWGFLDKVRLSVTLDVMLLSNALNVEQGPAHTVTIPQCFVPGLGFTQHHLVTGVAQLVGDPSLATGCIPRRCGSKTDRNFRPSYFCYLFNRDQQPFIYLGNFYGIMLLKSPIKNHIWP